MRKPSIRIEKTKHHFDIQYSVWFNDTVVGYCDTKTRADFLKRALRVWIRTNDFADWAGTSNVK